MRSLMAVRLHPSPPRPSPPAYLRSRPFEVELIRHRQQLHVVPAQLLHQLEALAWSMRERRLRASEGLMSAPIPRRWWLVQADDKAGWNWDRYLKRPIVRSKRDDRGWGGETWIRGNVSRKRIREEFSPGDLAFCYQGAPSKSVVGLAGIASRGYVAPGERAPATF